MINESAYSRVLEEIARELDIPPHKYKEAVERHRVVGQWLEDGEYPPNFYKPEIYVQGSFRLGTVTRPIRDGVEAEYDIDLVFETAIKESGCAPGSLKGMVGDRLRGDARYKAMLDKEGRRCWKLKYAEKDGIGFHLDVLPSVSDPRWEGDTSIRITDRQGAGYCWSESNPRGYAEWFDSKNQDEFNSVREQQKTDIFNTGASGYARVDEVPDELVRTSLQRVIQILKRHRDIYFNNHQNKDFAPISIIITTLVAQLHQPKPNLYLALKEVILKLSEYESLPTRSTVSGLDGLIQYRSDGKWYIENPVHKDENFADRWHEDNHTRAKAFFAWVQQLRADLIDIPNKGSPSALKRHFSAILGVEISVTVLGLTPPPPPPKVHIDRPGKPFGEVEW